MLLTFGEVTAWSWCFLDPKLQNVGSPCGLMAVCKLKGSRRPHSTVGDVLLWLSVIIIVYHYCFDYDYHYYCYYYYWCSKPDSLQQVSCRQPETSLSTVLVFGCSLLLQNSSATTSKLLPSRCSGKEARSTSHESVVLGLCFAFRAEVSWLLSRRCVCCRYSFRYSVGSSEAFYTSPPNSRAVTSSSCQVNCSQFQHACRNGTLNVNMVQVQNGDHICKILLTSVLPEIHGLPCRSSTRSAAWLKQSGQAPPNVGA